MSKVAEEQTFAIRNRRIGPQVSLYLIAEIGLNHGGDADRAVVMAEAACAAGAAAVKLQTVRAATLVAASCPAPAHVRATSLQAFFAGFELDRAAHAAVAAAAHAASRAFISTPFDEAAVDLLVGVGADALKIASGDLTHHRLIACAARTGLPLILSTGMSELEEVHAAVRCARDHGAGPLALLHCVSAYPVPAGSENLGAIRALAAAFDVPVGLSDHGRDDLSVPMAVALGATLYERHFVLPGDRTAIDAPVSSTGEELRQMMVTAERARRLLGHGRRECLPAERVNRRASRRGIYAARPIAAGATLGEADLVCLRPEHEVGARAWPQVIGARVRQAVPAGAPLAPELIEGWEDWS
jgi:N-acetylneuraminate synthase/N,N'-diacetyllegionaminate synthase